MVTTAKVRRAMTGAVLAVGMGLLGFSLHGLVSLDSQLSDAAQRGTPSVQQLPVSDERDCPYDRDRPARGTGIEA